MRDERIVNVLERTEKSLRDYHQREMIIVGMLLLAMVANFAQGFFQ